MLQPLRLGLALLCLALPLRAQQLELRFLDVGQGDAILIREGGKTALVDAGRSSAIVPKLRALGVTNIDLLVATHNQADHIGGMAAVLTATRVQNYMDNGLPHTTVTYQRTIDAVEASGAQYRRAEARTFTLGSAQLRVLPPPRVSDQNNACVGLLIQYGEFRALLTGDSGVYELRYWLQQESIPRVQVVKIAHHGARDGTTPEWVNATQPELAVISVGGNNSYGHPSAAVEYQWQSAGARVRRTDLDGTILILAKRDGTFTETTERSSVAVDPGIASAVQGSTLGAMSDAPKACCRTCTVGKACGNSCISREYTCHKPAGCACDAQPNPGE